MSLSELYPPQDGDQVEAVVKWFNLSKGFGFVAPADDSPDAFLHVSVLTRAGLQQIAEGTKLLIELGNGPKGRQVMRIISVLGQAELPPRASDTPAQATGPVEEMTGTVKWFKPEKGFGFVAPDDEGKDVFVHKSIVSRLGLATLQTGQRVKMNVHIASKGREAVDIEIIQ
ncbi:MAG: cold-shock protein [Proteobacteria bacterium]|nr:cold shock domain-containing protein [Alphaproteobacteria bacterium]NCC03913.1 cold-shock protein [Pseudomonadota bacterium]